MSKNTLVLAAMIGLSAAPALAQGKFEASAFYGWAIVGGAPLPAQTTINGASYTQADPRNGGTLGFTFGAYAESGLGLEFLWSRQATTLDVTGTGPALSGDMNIYSYHGQVVYQFGEPEQRAHLFLLGGLGATRYSDVVLTAGDVTGRTRFSWAFGGGFKFYPSRRIGVKGMLRFVPTFVEAWESGFWCEPFTPSCSANSGAPNSDQIEFSVGLVIRF